MQKIFRVKLNGKLSGFISFGGNSSDRRKAARAHQKACNACRPDGSTTVQRVRGATSTIPVKHYVHERAMIGAWANGL